MIQPGPITSGSAGRSDDDGGSGGGLFSREPQKDGRGRSLAICVVLALAVWAVFGQTWHHEFVNYDDNVFIVENPQVLGGLTWAGVKWAFRFDHGDYWHPLTWLSLMVDVSWFGRGAGGMHLMNVLLHTVNSLLLFLLLQRWTGATWRSALVAALFAVHPLRVEAVAWVTARKDVLSAFFGLLALLFYVRFAQGQARGPWSVVRGPWSVVPYLASLICFALGLMSKAMLLTWPLVMLLLDYWPLGRVRSAECGVGSVATRNSEPSRIHSALRIPHSALLWEKLPFLVLGVISAMLTYWGQHRQPAPPTAADLSLLLRMQDFFVAYGRYLGKTFWPAVLATPYAHPGQWSRVEVGWSMALMAGLCVFAWQVRRRRPYIFVGWFWFVVTLIPVIGLTRGWLQFMADRFTYVPLVGVFVAVAWGVADTRFWQRLPPFIGAVVAAAVLGACLMRTNNQVQYWQNSESLFRHALAAAGSGDCVALQNLGVHLANTGRQVEALDCFRRALALSPARPIVNAVETALGEIESRRKEPRFSERRISDHELAAAHRELAGALIGQRKYDDAIRHYQRSMLLAPADATTHYHLGLAFSGAGQSDDAMREYQRALELEPDHVGAHNNLGVALALSGRLDQAVTHFAAALQRQPDNAEAHNNYAYALVRLGRRAEAVQHLKEALRLKPDYEQARQQLRELEAAGGK